MCCQTFKAPALDRVVLRLLDARLLLDRVPGRAGLGRQVHRAVVPGKLLQLGSELRIEPVGVQPARLQVIDHHRRGDGTEVTEGIFQTAQKTLAGLPPHGVAVGLHADGDRHNQQEEQEPSSAKVSAWGGTAIVAGIRWLGQVHRFSSGTNS